MTAAVVIAAIATLAAIASLFIAVATPRSHEEQAMRPTAHSKGSRRATQTNFADQPPLDAEPDKHEPA